MAFNKEVMKKILITLITVFSLSFVQAQTPEEWTEQNKTQTKYLMQQLAALKMYGGVVKQGYQITRAGLTLLHNIKEGDFRMHADYFTSLKTVNPNIKAYSKIASLIALHVRIIQHYSKAMKDLKENDRLTGKEITYIQSVFTHLLNVSSALLDELILLTTDGKLQLTDDQRIRRMDALYGEIQNRDTFIRGFIDEVNLLTLQRIKQQRDIKAARHLYGLSR
jgi:hypothetical protein